MSAIRRLFRFGGLVPWVGFRQSTIPLEMVREQWPSGAYRLAPGSMDEVLVNALEAEWFGVGLVLCVRPL